MTHSINEKLVADLAHLLKKYGEDEFDRLALALRDETFCRDLADTFGKLSSLSKTAIVVREKRKPKKNNEHSNLLAPLQEVDREKFEILVEFRKGVLSRRLLPEATHIHEFALSCGIKPLQRRMSRERATNQLLRSLMGLSTSELRAKLASIPQSRDSSESYQRWVDLILRRDER